MRIYHQTLKMLIRELIIFAVTLVITTSASGCASTETEVTTRWIFVDDPGITCAKLIGGIADTYNIMFRKECQFAMNTDTLPRRAENVYITECFAMGNGTVKYKANLCCAGIVANSCYSCVGEPIQTDQQNSLQHTDKCNFYSNPVERCASGQVCQTTLDYGTDDKPIVTVTKKCSGQHACLDLEAGNADTCKRVLNPRCTYCCQQPLCNRQVTIKALVPLSSDKCHRVSCRNGGTCVPDDTLVEGFKCNCRPGIIGKFCKQSICTSRPCLEGGVCRRSVEKPYYTCGCRIGRSGKNCEIANPTCSTKGYCLNSGTCYDHGVRGQRCLCKKGFAGSQCQLARSMECGNVENFIETKEIVSRRINTCSILDIRTSGMESLRYYIKMCRNFMSNKYGKEYRDGKDGKLIQKIDSVMLLSCQRGDRHAWVKHGVCCSACLSAPCENGGWCISTNDDYVCKCRFGYEGKNCQHKVSICYASGDPHYRTFDGQLIHFQGRCTYDLASPKFKVPGLPEFSVITRNEERNGIPGVSYLKYVQVEINGMTFRIDRDYKIYLNGDRIYPDASFDGVKLVMNGRFVRLETDFGLVVESDTSWTTTVKIPETLSGTMGGLCGDANQVATDDLKTKEGQDVSDSKYKFSLIGNSWQVPNPEQPGCLPKLQEEPKACVSPLLEQLDTVEYCGLIKDDDTSPFRHCLTALPHLIQAYMENCRYDVCSKQDHKPKIAACGTMEALSVECFNRGYVVNWREMANCPLKCPNSMKYVQSGTACHATCSNPSAPEQCRLHDRESCRCKDNSHVLVDDNCVPAQTCGCIDKQGNKREIGDTWTNDDCTKQYTCEECLDCVKPVGKITAADTYCEWHEKCSKHQGESTCVDINECEGVKCLNGGVCNNGVGKFVCECKSGFEGIYCQTNTDDCSPNPCENQAECKDGIDSYQCKCQQGFNGFNCQIDIDECKSNPCKNGAECEDDVNGYTCKCVTGFEGKHCQTDIDECQGVVCLNGGVCKNRVGEFLCECKSGFEGIFCQTNIDECKSNPCKNGAECEDDVNGYTCKCVPGFEGKHCQTDIDECQGVVCLNGGVCKNEVGKFVCDCKLGFKGIYCQTNVDECKSNPCKNGAECEDDINGYTCKCMPGFEGKHCQTDPDDCEVNSCFNGGECFDQVNGFRCQCRPGYSGQQCQTNDDDCKPNPCENDSKCKDQVNGYTCTCKSGYQGTNCELEIDECASNPCKNNARCQNLNNKYMCVCNLGFAGVNCEIDTDPCSPNPCQHGGKCERKGVSDQISCDCQGTLHNGALCQFENPTAAPLVDPCSSNPCPDEGECEKTNTGYRCKASLIKDFCYYAPCQNGGSCKEFPMDATTYTIMCLCPQGFHGPLCDNGENDPYWTQWSPWSKCSRQASSPSQDKCDSKFGRYRVRVCSSEDESQCEGSSIEREECQCDRKQFKADRDCQLCNITQGVGFLEDPCDCSSFYQCQQLDNGHFTASNQRCPQCLRWNAEQLTCSVRVSGCQKDSVQQETESEECELGEVPGRPGFYSTHGHVMPCPGGTVFSLVNCTCIIDRSVTLPPNSASTTCLNFQKGWNGFSTSNGAYVQVKGVKRRLLSKGYVAKFNGKQHLEIPSFSNAYSQLRPFSIAFLYKRTGSQTGLQGMIDNGNCAIKPSLVIKSTKTELSVKMVNGSGVELVSSGHATSAKWNRVVLTYDGSEVILYLNGVRTILGEFSGPLKESHCPLVIGHSSTVGGFFTGYMDNLCIYKTALSEAQVNLIPYY